ncbi:MAG TPA: AMIN domain-containing protein, partial [Candidatus Elarobacter sp.]|nr:AMIN domain-containing protein [Candidatus Elarobacter sp.]
MKLTTGILAVAMMTGAAWAQSPDANNNQSNAAQKTAVAPTQGAQQTKPTPGAPAPMVKPAQIPGAKPAGVTKPASTAPLKPAAAPAKAAVKPSSSASAAGQPNRLDGVHVLHNADDVQIEISSREAVTPKVSKLSSPARVVVELPATVMATPQNKIAVGTAGVKGVRIGMDG